MSTPDFVICLECETPLYTFEYSDSKVKEALCPTCGNDQANLFATEEDYEEMTSLSDNQHRSSDE